jgi:hypothetical protein
MNKTLIHSTGFEIKTTKMVLWETQAGSFTMAEMKLLIDYLLTSVLNEKKNFKHFTSLQQASNRSLSDRKGLLFTGELFHVCSLVQKSGGKN